MPMTVADIVALPVMQAGDPEVASARSLDTPVRWVHVSDVADLSRLLQGGELVFTRGGPLRRAPRRYLERLAQARAIGVVVELSAETDSLPRSVAEIADNLDLTLVVLHRQIKFVEVTEEVHRRIVADQYDQVAFAWRVHELFTDLSMRRADPAEIVDAAADLLDAPVVLEDLAHQVLAIAAAGRRTAPLLGDWERRSRRQSMVDGPGSTDTAWALSAVGRGDEQWARLIAVEPPDDAARTSMVLERAAQALVMHRMAERGRTDIEHRAQAGLIDDVLRHRVRSEDDVAARAFALGMRPAPSYVAAAVRVRDWYQDPDPVAAQQHDTRLLDAVVRATTALGHTGLFSARGPGEIMMVLSLNLSNRGERVTLDALGAALDRGARAQDGIEGLVLAVTQAASGLVEAIDATGEAAHIADVAASMAPSRLDTRICFRLSDIRLRGVISSLRTDPRVQRFAESELRQLILHDLQHGDDLLGVLRGYLELAHHKSALAARLHLSRPALYAKLAKIEKILGVDLADGESATSLHVALLIRDASWEPLRRDRSASVVMR